MAELQRGVERPSIQRFIFEMEGGGTNGIGFFAEANRAPITDVKLKVASMQFFCRFKFLNSKTCKKTCKTQQPSWKNIVLYFTSLAPILVRLKIILFMDLGQPFNSQNPVSVS